MSDEGSRTSRRRYRPEVEGLEALRLLSGLSTVAMPVPADQGSFGPAEPTIDAATDPAIDPIAWDAALGLSEIAELIAARDGADPETIRRGLDQLDRYLGRTWARAGLPSHKHDDCTQAVYLSLLDNLGRDGFDGLVAEVGRVGIRDVLSRETPEGPDFFRAIDATKKRAQRERSHHSLDDGAVEPAGPPTEGDWSQTLVEAFDRALSPREAELMRSTLAGMTPAEIAEHWGVAPKTVSNEKTRAFGKLRSFLVDQLDAVA